MEKYSEDQWQQGNEQKGAINKQKQLEGRNKTPPRSKGESKKENKTSWIEEWMSEGQKWCVKQATSKLNQTSKLNEEWRVKRLRGESLFLWGTTTSCSGRHSSGGRVSQGAERPNLSPKLINGGHIKQDTRVDQIGNPFVFFVQNSRHFGRLYLCCIFLAPWDSPRAFTSPDEHRRRSQSCSPTTVLLYYCTTVQL